MCCQNDQCACAHVCVCANFPMQALVFVCAFACVTAIIGFPAGTVVKVADLTVLWAAPGEL